MVQGLFPAIGSGSGDSSGGRVDGATFSVGSWEMFRRKCKRRRRWSRTWCIGRVGMVGVVGPPSPHVLLPGKLGGQANAAGEGKSSMRQPLCAATIIGPTARQVSPCRKAPNLSQAPAAAPDWTRCIHRPGYIIRILPASREQFCGAGIGREPEWASTSRLQSPVNSSRGRRRVTARQAKMIQLKVCSAPTESQASS